MDATSTGASAPAPARTGYAESPLLRMTRGVYPLFATLAPGLASRAALRLFLTPRRHKTPAWERTHLESARPATLKVGKRAFKAYAWGDGPRTIVMCHSWGGRGSQLGAFVPELTQRGFRVVAFDAPAHGASEGRQTDMMEYSSAVAAVVLHFGPVYGLLGHSFGAGNALFSWRRFRFPVERVALVGCFSNAIWITERFGELVGIPQKTIAAMRSRLERRHQGELQWESLVIGEMAREFPGPLMAVHDRDDAEIPYFHAERLLKASGRAADCLLTTSGLGHRRIVRDAAVVKAVGGFFSGAVA
ncbi:MULTISPECIES: alpha/beta hydrolase [Hydrogenophaga]|jgi:fermentation-respiration switch protein FrsA (DUF1100 family)|uniref:Putative Lysophospholipase n=1 Tax=Hydrogenophaga intermedia TaxID=65786 RepID=A0A1L1PPX7_HYDIT|nr:MULTISPECIES: alpha/beta hydrolase [Hydrogenophaga]TMU77340.1 alpha/beta hydrolase [Hydrogenophaga intermedia]CDN89749.1 Putative Lysophospholipase [Hydrogenophaga intermedia]